MAELQVLAGAGGVALRAQRVLHLLDLQLEGVEGAEDLLHAVVVVLVVGVHGRVVHHLAGVDVPASPALHGGLDGERVDDIAGRSLVWRDERWRDQCESEDKNGDYNIFDCSLVRLLTGGPGGPVVPVSPFGPV